LSENLKPLHSIHSSNFQLESSQRKVLKEPNVKKEQKENVKVENAFIPSLQSVPSAKQTVHTSTSVSKQRHLNFQLNKIGFQ